MRTVLLAAGISIVAAAPVRSQVHQPPSMVAADPFTHVADLHAFADGRLLVVDASEHAVWLVAADGHTRTAVGRRGRGPREFLTPWTIIREPGDTLLVYDVGNRRFLRVSPDGEAVGTVRIPPELFANGAIAVPHGDTLGRAYFERGRIVQTGSGWARDPHAVILRLDPSSGRVDSITTITIRGPDDLVSGIVPFPSVDGWDVAADGTIGVVVASDYHVEWRAADGATRGPVTPYDRITVTAAEREAFRDGLIGGSRGGASHMTGGAGAANGGARRSIPPIPDDAFPRFEPPIASELSTFATPDGELWALRSRAHDDSIPVFDVFDRRGLRVRTIALPANSRVVAFGPGVVYLVRRDADDLEWLGRYRYTR